MTRNEYVAICKTCKNQAFNPRQGVICGLTKEIAAFEDECKSYELDEQELVNVQAKQLSEDDGEKAARKEMLYGGLWCFGGAILTFMEIGYIFWGAILFGGVQFIKGAIKLNGYK